MGRPRVLSPQPLLDLDAITALFAKHDVKSTWAVKLLRAFIHHELKEADSPPTYSENWVTESWLPKELPLRIRGPLQREFKPIVSTIVTKSVAADNRTCKLLLRTQDGHEIETVVMHHETRSTVCVSSQVGCKMACTFCATGKLGLKANLTAGEILEQLLQANRVSPIRNIVFMGMGEPMDNYEAVLGALRVMTDPGLYSLKAKHITVSTVGVPRGMLALVDDFPLVNLALSLHAATQELRERIVPSARAWPLEGLMATLDECLHRRGASVMIEYIVLHKVNDLPQHAHELGRLLKGRDVWINLIPYNPNFAVGIDEFEPPPEHAVRAFHETLHDNYGLHVRVRQEMGQDIAAACGQLALVAKADRGATIENLDTAGFERLAAEGAAPQVDLEDTASGAGGPRQRRSKATKTPKTVAKGAKAAAPSRQSGARSILSVVVIFAAVFLLLTACFLAAQDGHAGPVVQAHAVAIERSVAAMFGFDVRL